ncbi:MAG TPA: hypothetical protein VMU75_09670 [Acidimicrobiales bacterium]|nr:hypothetical protein [Acidimicrobiales bacterium]
MRAPRPLRSRLGRGAALAALLATSGTALAACGQGSSALGHKACVEVSRSLRLFHQSESSPDPSKAASLRSQALIELRRALPSAALAGASDGQWQALMATLSESSRVPEADLVTALSAQCAQTLSS